MAVETKRPEPNSSKLSFEEAMRRIEEIVAALEGGQADLDKSLALFEEGMGLFRFCTQKLDDAEGRILMLVKDAGGEDRKPLVKPFDVEESAG
ncbi:MAG TPA: exodeoxyribonuclease VII small subunit [Firmicutes bacterium]|nr:exodeoxyribonuclease VII small subunit [Bacillota bacterium]